MGTLDLDPLRNSVRALRGAVMALDALPAQARGGEDAPDMREILRSAVVKNFEVAYEVAWKSMRRWLLAAEGEVAVEQLRSRRDLFRACAACGLLDDPGMWFRFHEARDAGAHVYREDIALASLAAARLFGGAAAQLLERFDAAPAP